MTQDPTRDEMLAFLEAQPFAGEFDDFDREEAIYWFANHWHSGQYTNLYAALCQSTYRPGPTVTGPEPDGPSEMLYQDLEAEYCA